MPHTYHKKRHLFEFSFHGVQTPHVTFLATGPRGSRATAGARRAKDVQEGDPQGRPAQPVPAYWGRPQTSAFTPEGTATSGCYSGTNDFVPAVVAGSSAADVGT